MENNGWYKIERKIFRSPIFKKDEPYSEREAWVWMIGSACFEKTIINILNNPVKLNRGQFSHSIRFLSEKFKWSRGRVENFIKRLERFENITTDSKTGQKIVTICNYSKYQDVQEPSKTGQRQDKDRTKTKNKELRNKELRIKYNIGEILWDEFVKLRDKKKALITARVLDSIKIEAKKTGWSLEQAIAEMCDRGWAGFKANWVNKNNINKKGKTKYDKESQKSRLQREAKELMASFR